MLSRGLGWRIHGSVEDTKLSTNKQHSLSQRERQAHVRVQAHVRLQSLRRHHPGNPASPSSTLLPAQPAQFLVHRVRLIQAHKRIEDDHRKETKVLFYLKNPTEFSSPLTTLLVLLY